MILDLDRLVAVVMAGGGGTRFWPRSRKSMPKQFLSFDGKGSLLSNTLARLEGLVPPERTYVITGSEHVSMARRHASALPEPNVIGEPVGKDTGACVGLATLLNTKIGYMQAAEIAKESEKSGRPVKDIVVEKGLMKADEFDALVLQAAHGVGSGGGGG